MSSATGLARPGDQRRRRRWWAVGAVVAVLVAAVSGVALVLADRAPQVTPGTGWAVVVASLRPELSRAQAVTVGAEVLLLGGTGAEPGSTEVTPGMAITTSTEATRELAAPPFDHALELVGAQRVDDTVVVVGNVCLGPEPGSSAGACRTSASLQAAAYDIAGDRWTAAPAPEVPALTPGTGPHLLTGVGTSAGSALFSVDHTGQVLGYDPANRRWEQAAPALRSQDVSVCAGPDAAVATTVNYLNQGTVTATYPGTVVDGALEVTGTVDYVQPQARQMQTGAGWAAPSAPPLPDQGATDVLDEPVCTDNAVVLPTSPDLGGPTSLWHLPLTPEVAPHLATVPTGIDFRSGWLGRVAQGDRIVLWKIGQVYDVAADTWSAITLPPDETADLICTGTSADIERVMVRCHAFPDGRDDQTAKPSVVLTLTTAAAHR